MHTLFSLRRTVLVAGLLLGAASVPSATAQPGSGGPGPGTPAVTTVPIDGGASLLLASGIGYGLARLRQARRTRKK